MLSISSETFLKHFSSKLYARYNGYYWGSVNETNVIDENLFWEIERGSAHVAATVSNKDGNSSYLVLDIDGQKDGSDENVLRTLSDNLSAHIETFGIKSTVFFSGRRGYHHYIFISQPLSIFSLRNIGKKVLSTFDTDYEIEVFPKQTSVDWENNKYGNHLKLPLSTHPITGLVAYQVTDYVCNDVELLRNIESEIFTSVGIDAVVTALSTIFTDSKRHAVTMAVSGFLKTNKITKNTCEVIFRKLVAVSGGDSGDIQRVLDDTYDSEKLVASLSYSSDITEEINNTLYLFVAKMSPYIGVKEDIVKTRLQKGASFIKVDRVSRIIVTYVSSKYRIFQDGSYFYLVSSSETISDSDNTFSHFLHNLGLNIVEAFTKQVMSSISTYFMTNGEFIERVLFSRYHDRTLTIYQNNSNAIVVTDSAIEHKQVTYPTNTIKYFHYVDSYGKVDRLLNSFGLSKTDCDLVLTWLISQFFIDIMNTKPILLINGKPGSGKTTLASVLLKLVENLDSTSIAFSSDRRDLITSLTRHKMLVLDNVEYLDPKLIDFINSVTTGTQIEFRKLYTTNEPVVIKPRCSICLTSAYELFNTDGALVSRSVNVTVPKRDSYGVESQFNDLIAENYSKLMSEILDICQRVIQRLPSVNIAEGSSIRLTDFSIIGRCLRELGIIDTDIEVTIANRQHSAKLLNPIIKIFTESGGPTNTPFDLSTVALKIISKSALYGLNVNAGNLRHKLLATGLFEQLDEGKLICTF